MIEFKKGDIFTSTCEALVNPVNCEGVMGKGLAKAFKDRFPLMFPVYQKLCAKGEMRIGDPRVGIYDNVKIVLFPTKDSWRNPSKIEYIDQGLQTLKEKLKPWAVQSLALPALGCGLGGLEWTDVKSLIVKYLGTESIPIEVYEP